MQFTTSFFSPSLFGYNLKRYWPLALAVLIVIILFPGMGILRAPAVLDMGNQQVVSYVTDLACMSGPVMVVCMAPAGLLAALLVFDYLRKRSKVRFHHGLPLARRASFVTNYICGFALIAVPVVVGLLACMGMAAAVGASASIPAIGRLMAVSLASLVLFYSMGVIACIVTGNALGAILVYVAMNCAVLVVLLGFGALISALLPGIDITSTITGPARWFTPVYQLVTALIVSGSYAPGVLPPLDNAHVPVVYLVVGIVMLVLAGFLYRIRRDEASGETVAFRVVGIICKILFALVVSAIGAALVLAVGYDEVSVSDTLAPALVAHVIFAIIGWFVAEMIVGRTLRAVCKRTLVSCAIFVAAILVVSGLMAVDVLGLVHKVPDAQKVESAQVEVAGHTVAMDPADASKLHASVLEAVEMDLYGTSSQTFGLYGGGNTIDFDYKLSSGATMHRSYRYSFAYDSARNVVIDTVVAGFDTPRYVHEFYFSVEPGAITESNIEAVTLTVHSASETGEVAGNGLAALARENESVDYTFQGKAAYGLYQAVCQDIEQGNLGVEEYFYGKQSIGNFNIEWNMPIDEVHSEYTDRGVDITPDMTVTQAWIKAHKDEAITSTLY